MLCTIILSLRSCSDYLVFQVGENGNAIVGYESATNIRNITIVVTRDTATNDHASFGIQVLVCHGKHSKSRTLSRHIYSLSQDLGLTRQTPIISVSHFESVQFITDQELKDAYNTRNKLSGLFLFLQY